MPTCCVLFERSLYKECGGFDLALERQEDWNLWLRFAIHAGRFARIRKTTSLYRVPSLDRDQTSRAAAMLEYYEKAKVSHKELALTLPVEELGADYRILLEHHADHTQPWPLQPPPIEPRMRRWMRWPIRFLRRTLRLERPKSPN